MIKANEAHRADLFISASTTGFWIRGAVGSHEIDITLQTILTVKYYLKGMDAHSRKALGRGLSVFDMTERILK